MDISKLPYIAAIFALAIGWFTFIGKAIREDAKSLGINDANQIGMQATITPWWGIIYFFTRHTMPKALINSDEAKAHKKASYIYFLIGILFLAAGVAFVMYLNAVDIF